MDILRELKVRLGLDVDDKGFKKADKGIGNLSNKVKQLGALIGVGFLGRKLKDMASQSLQAADALKNQADQVGVSTEFFQSWSTAASNAGVELGTFKTAMEKFIKTFGEAQVGVGTGIQWIEKFNLKLKDVNGNVKSSEEFILDMADAISTIEEQGQKAAVADAFFNPQFVNVLGKGRKALEEQFRAFRELGVIMDEDAVENASKLTKRWAILGSATDGLVFKLTTHLTPSLEYVTTSIEKMFRWLNTSREGMSYLNLALIGLGALLIGIGTAFIVAFGPAVLMALGVAAAITAIVLIADDLIGLFTGKKSAIGGFLDELLGFDVAQGIFKGIAVAVLTVVDAVDAAVSGLRILFNLLTLDFSEAKSVARSLTNRLSGGNSRAARYLAGFGQNVANARAGVTSAVAPSAPLILSGAGSTNNSQQVTNTFNIRGDNAQDIAKEVRKVLSIEYDFTTDSFTQDFPE